MRVLSGNEKPLQRGRYVVRTQFGDAIRSSVPNCGKPTRNNDRVPSTTANAVPHLSVNDGQRRQRTLCRRTLHIAICSGTDRTQWIDELKAAQRPDGGWSLATLTENSREPERQTDAAQLARNQSGHGESFLVYVGRDEIYRTSLASDGYATGFSLFVLRHAGEPAAAPALRRGIAWLKSNQRVSGRWFTPSQGWHTEHRITNAGNAFAVLALHACGEVK